LAAFDSFYIMVYASMQPVYIYRKHCAKRKAPVFNLLRGGFWGSSPLQGRHVAPMGWNLARRRGPSPLLRAKFHPIGATVRV